MKLCEIFGNPPPFNGPVMGVEVEVEGENLPKAADLKGGNWKITADGSLRGESAEYISKTPLPLEGIKTNILQLIKASTREGTKFDFSNRTSVHVHLNVMDLELQTFANLVYLYYLFEDVLLRYCGENRYSNRFCLSIRNAEGIIDGVIRNLNPHRVFSFSQEWYKYASLNLASPAVHGSLEFRGMRGNLDKEVLFPWLDVIQNLYVTAHDYKNPQEILQHSLDNLEELTKKVFKKHFEKFNFLGFTDEVAYNTSLCAELPQYLTLKEEKKAAAPKKVIKNLAGVWEEPFRIPPLVPEGRQVQRRVIPNREDGRRIFDQILNAGAQQDGVMNQAWQAVGVNFELDEDA